MLYIYVAPISQVLMTVTRLPFRIEAKKCQDGGHYISQESVNCVYCVDTVAESQRAHTYTKKAANRFPLDLELKLPTYINFCTYNTAHPRKWIRAIKEITRNKPQILEWHLVELKADFLYFHMHTQACMSRWPLLLFS